MGCGASAVPLSRSTAVRVSYQDAEVGAEKGATSSAEASAHATVESEDLNSPRTQEATLAHELAAVRLQKVLRARQTRGFLPHALAQKLCRQYLAHGTALACDAKRSAAAVCIQRIVRGYFARRAVAGRLAKRALWQLLKLAEEHIVEHRHKETLATAIASAAICIQKAVRCRQANSKIVKLLAKRYTDQYVAWATHSQICSRWGRVAIHVQVSYRRRCRHREATKVLARKLIDSCLSTVAYRLKAAICLQAKLRGWHARRFPVAKIASAVCRQIAGSANSTSTPESKVELDPFPTAALPEAPTASLENGAGAQGRTTNLARLLRLAHGRLPRGDAVLLASKARTHRIEQRSASPRSHTQSRSASTSRTKGLPSETLRSVSVTKVVRSKLAPIGLPRLSTQNRTRSTGRHSDSYKDGSSVDQVGQKKVSSPLSPVRSGKSVCPFMEISIPGLDNIVKACQPNDSDCIYDVGCGKGSILAAILDASFCRGVGVEVNPSLARAAKQRLQKYGKRVQIVVEDVCNVNLHEATKVVTFFFTSALAQVSVHIASSLRPGCVWLNYNWAVPGWCPSRPAHDGVYRYVIGDHLGQQAAADPLCKPTTGSLPPINQSPRDPVLCDSLHSKPPLFQRSSSTRKTRSRQWS